MRFSIFLHKFSKNRIDIQYFGKYSKSHGAISIFTIQIDFYCAHELYACSDAIFNIIQALDIIKSTMAPFFEHYFSPASQKFQSFL